MDWAKLFLSADGRIGRQTFWIGFLILLGANVVLGWIPLLGAIVSLILIYPWVCLYSKRFHDMGRSGWLAAIPTAVPAVLWTIALFPLIGGVLGAAANEGSGDGDAAVALFTGLGWAGLLFFAGFLAWAGGTLWAGVTASEPGSNRYGEPPSRPTAGVADPIVR